MDNTQRQELHISPPDLIVKAGAAALGMLAIFLLVLTISSFKEYRFIGSGVTATNTITVSGSDDVFAVPDTATFSVTVLETAKDVKAAQTVATKKANDIIAYLKGADIAEKDIRTTDYSINPQYEWTNGTCSSAGYCAPGKQTLTGFQVTQTLTIKTKDTAKAGELLSGVGAKGASQVSGLSFTIEDEDALQAEAREKAIAKARAKADQLASSLGVSVVRVVGFNEDGGGRPMYYAKTMAMDSMAGAEAAPAPEIPVGQNKITSNVSVTYEIR